MRDLVTLPAFTQFVFSYEVQLSTVEGMWKNGRNIGKIQTIKLLISYYQYKVSYYPVGGKFIDIVLKISNRYFIFIHIK